jgi:hypothetical protein
MFVLTPLNAEAEDVPGALHLAVEAVHGGGPRQVGLHQGSGVAAENADPGAAPQAQRHSPSHRLQNVCRAGERVFRTFFSGGNFGENSAENFTPKNVWKKWHFPQKKF